MFGLDWCIFLNTLRVIPSVSWQVLGGDNFWFYNKNCSKIDSLLDVEGQQKVIIKQVDSCLWKEKSNCFYMNWDGIHRARIPWKASRTELYTTEHPNIVFMAHTPQKACWNLCCNMECWTEKRWTAFLFSPFSLISVTLSILW